MTIKELEVKVQRGELYLYGVIYKDGVHGSPADDMTRCRSRRDVEQLTISNYYAMQTDADGNPLLDENGKMIYLEQDGVNGKEVILQKLDLVRTWLKDNFNVDLDQLRREVQNREWVTDADGNFVIEDGHLVNKLTAPSEENPSKTLMEVLLDEVNKFEALQQ